MCVYTHTRYYYYLTLIPCAPPHVKVDDCQREDLLASSPAPRAPMTVLPWAGAFHSRNSNPGKRGQWAVRGG